MNNRLATRQLIDAESINVLADIKYACACYFGVSEIELSSSRQGFHAVCARHVAIALSVRLTALTRVQIGHEFGRRDQHTVARSLGCARDFPHLRMAIDAVLYDLANPASDRVAA